MKKITSIFSLLAKVTAVLVVSLITGFVLGAAVGHVEYAPLIALPFYATALTANYKLPKMAFSAPAVFTEGICVDIQETLLNLMGSNSPSLTRTPVGYLQAVTSQANKQGFKQIPIPTNGKKRKVRVTYDQRALESEIEDEITSSCYGEVSDVPYEDEFEITREIQTKGIVFSEDEMRKLCEPDKTWIAKRINARFDALAVSLNKRLITLQNSNFGKFADGTLTVHQRQLLVAATKAAYYYGENQILNDFSDIDFPGRPILVGNGKLRDYTRIVKHGCCNANGLDVSTIGEFDYYQDRHVGSILGNADDFIGLAPGHVQFGTWNKYVGDYEKNYGNIIKTTMQDPYTGILYDMTWKYDDCEEVWILKLSLHWDLFFMPNNIFATGDPLSGVNYTLHYRAIEA